MAKKLIGDRIFAGSYELSGHANAITLETRADSVDFTTMNDTARRRQPGLKMSAFSVAGYADYVAAPIQATWTPRTTPNSNGFWAVAFGNDLFVAVSITGTLDRVMTSPDGVTWTPRTTPNNNNYQSIVFGNNLFVAVSSNGTLNNVMTSPDGVTWTARTTPNSNELRGIAFGNNLFVAVSRTGTLNMSMTSPDGVTWTARTTPNSNEFYSIIFGNNLFVAVSSNGTLNNVMTSPDGVTWTARTTPNSNDYFGVVFGDNLFVAVSSTGTLDRVMTSPDGVTWTARTTPNNNAYIGIAFGNNLFVSVSSTGTLDRVMTSPDGVTWTARTTPNNNDFRGIAFGNNLFVAVSNTGTLNMVMTSPLGNTSEIDTDAAVYTPIGLSETLLSLGDNTASAGSVGYFCKTVAAEYSTGAAINDAMPFSFSGEMDGELYRGTIMHNGTLTATAAGTAYQVGQILAGKSLYAIIHLTETLGIAPTLDINIQSDDNSGMTSAVTRGSFTQLTQNGSEFITPIAGAITDDYWRISSTIGSTATPSFKFIVIFAIF